MTPLSAQLEAQTMRDTLGAFFAAGVSQEELIGRMRTMGLNQLTCIKMLRDIAGISLGDAKEVVHFSAAWADQRAANEALHEAAFAAAEELGYR